jgi:Stress responsive A/B Barrel Domain
MGDKMIRHIVLVRFRSDVTEAQIAAIFADLQAIKAILPGVLGITSGRSESPEQMERGYMHGFVVDFTDWAALDAYQNHPDHKRVGAALVAGAVGGIEGILVFDLAVGE